MLDKTIVSWIKNAYLRLKEKEIIERLPLEISCQVIGGEPVPYETAIRQDFVPAALGDKWGVAWDTVWFKFTGTIPQSWAGHEVIAFIELGGPANESFGWEGLVWDKGKPVRAIGGFRNDIPLYNKAAGGEGVSIIVEGASNVNAPRHRYEPVDGVDIGGELLFDIRRAEIAIADEKRMSLMRKWKFLIDYMNAFSEEDLRRAHLYASLKDVSQIADTQGWNAIDLLCDKISAAYKSIDTGTLPHTVTAIGHCHIDTAWCWPVRESVRKCARSFATALSYMKKYPHYIFGASQTLQYKWMAEKYPSIWQDIRAAVARGQWEVLAGMWVEPDCIVPCGESLVRQIVYGKNWIKENLGVDVKILWLPDVFGYNAALPQIMALAGIDGFFTQKLSWNQVNRFPHHTFWWEGLDGTRVLAHFPPSDTYGGSAEPSEVLKGTMRFMDHDKSSESLYAYGHGDGGGGPTQEMIESVQFMGNLGGLPSVKPGTVHGFFESIRENAADLNVWSGELYLETHRGTYTTASMLKMGNRNGETKLREADFCVSLVNLLCPETDISKILCEFTDTIFSYAQRTFKKITIDEVLRHAWELLLLNQFHDILPGTSIPWVTSEATRDHALVMALAESVCDACYGQIDKRLSTPELKNAFWCVNPSGFTREGVFDTPVGPVWGNVPPWGWAPVTKENQLPSSIHPVNIVSEGNDFVIDNGIIRMTIGNNGDIRSVFDYRKNREIVKTLSKLNQLRIHIDLPNDSDAWDIDTTYKLMGQDVPDAHSVSVTEQNELRVVLCVKRQFSKSSITQNIVVRAGSPCIDFETHVVWKEEHRMLRVYFPCALLSSRATHGIQYGHIERPTHANTSWDSARFETGGQRWVDISEHGYGVAILDNGRFGRSVAGNEIGISLLRSPRSPDPVMDLGEHDFTYSLFPHCGDLVEGGVISEAARLNQPLVFREWPKSSGELPSEASWFSSTGMIIDWIKPAEDGDGVIIRGYEGSGGRGNARISVPINGVTLKQVNLLEEGDEGGVAGSSTHDFLIRPFQIQSFRCNNK